MENLESSRLLFDNEMYRNSITLSYYAMFLSVKALLLSKDITSKTHAGTISLFYENFVKNGLIDKELHKCFASAQTLREHASYGAYDDYSKEKASSKIKCAEELIIMSNELLNGKKVISKKSSKNSDLLGK